MDITIILIYFIMKISILYKIIKINKSETLYGFKHIFLIVMIKVIFGWGVTFPAKSYKLSEN